MAASSRAAGGSLYAGSSPYRSRDGLSTRPVSSSNEIQLRIDPMHVDFDEEITGLRGQVKILRNVAQDISTEAKFQRDFLDQLQMTMIKAQAGVKNNIRKLNKNIIKRLSVKYDGFYLNHIPSTTSALLLEPQNGRSGGEIAWVLGKPLCPLSRVGSEAEGDLVPSTWKRISKTRVRFCAGIA